MNLSKIMPAEKKVINVKIKNSQNNSKDFLTLPLKPPTMDPSAL